MAALSREDFRMGVDSSAARRRREDSGSSLRKARREETIAKRRSRVASPSWTELPRFTPVAEGAVDEMTIDIVTAREVPEVAAPVSMSALADRITCGDPNEMLVATEGFRRLLSREKAPPLDEVLSHPKAIRRLVEFLTARAEDFPGGSSSHVRDVEAVRKLQFEAAWALTNLASGAARHTRAVVEAGAVPSLILLLSASPIAECREQAIWCLGNIAGDSEGLRALVLKSGALLPILENVVQSEANMSLLRNSIWAISNLCRFPAALSRPGVHDTWLKSIAPAAAVLAQVLLNCDDDEALESCIYALGYIGDKDDARIRCVVETGVTERLVQILVNNGVPRFGGGGGGERGAVSPPRDVYRDRPVAAVVQGAVTLCGQICSSADPLFTQGLLDAGVLAAASSLVALRDKPLVRKDILWLLSNVASGTYNQVTALLQEKQLLADVFVCLRRGEDFAIRREALYVILNILRSTHEHVFALQRDHGDEVERGLCSFLTGGQGGDEGSINDSLDGIEILLKCDETSSGLLRVREAIERSDGLELLHEIALRDEDGGPSEACQKANLLLEVYFDGDMPQEEF